MPNPRDARVTAASLYFLPVETRVPLKFGPETLTHVTCARAAVEVAGAGGETAVGWGETPLSVQWVWPSDRLGYEERHQSLRSFCIGLAAEWSGCEASGHPLEIGQGFQEEGLQRALARHNRGRDEQLPYLAALVCCSPFDIALHDAYGKLHDLPAYETYRGGFMNRDLGAFLEPAAPGVDFAGTWPADYLRPRRNRLPAWHLVGGLDPLDRSELTGDEPDDGYPVLLRDWIRTDGLTCLKVKLRGTTKNGTSSACARWGRSPSIAGRSGSPPTSTARSATPSTSTGF